MCRSRPVRSTIAQLLAAQNQWNSKLAALFAQRDLRTSIEPQSNAVSVVLSSSVPARQRATLKREAAAADVNVHITVAPSAHLEIIEQAGECNFSLPRPIATRRSRPGWKS